MLKVSLETFGCKVNTYDTGLLQKRLVSDNFKIHEGRTELADVMLLNTCAVTKEATREAVRRIRWLKARNPLGLVVVTGCAAQVDTDEFSNLPGVDLVVANSHKAYLPDLVRQFYAGTLKQKVHKSNIFKKEDLEAGGGIELGHTRSFLKIQDGCNSFCTFCVIPFARGKSRSIPVTDLVRRVQELSGQGVREIVLTGVHIGDYQDESRTDGRIEALLEQILLKTTISRIRLTSFEPIELSPRLMNLFKDPRLCPHFHMSIQSAQTKVLKDMKRQYGHIEVEKALLEIEKEVPGAFVGMDVIVGFPGESSEEYLETKNRLEALPWTRIHVFPYSERPGTYATRIPEKVEVKEIQVRAKDLRELSSQRFARRALDQIGLVKSALKLKSKDDSIRALTRDFWPVQVELGAGLNLEALGPEFDVKVTGFDHSENQRMDGLLLAEALPL